MRDLRVLALLVDLGNRHYNAVFVPLVINEKLCVNDALRIARHIHNYEDRQLSLDIRGPWAIHDDLRKVTPR